MMQIISYGSLVLPITVCTKDQNFMGNRHLIKSQIVFTPIVSMLLNHGERVMF